MCCCGSKYGEHHCGSTLTVVSLIRQPIRLRIENNRIGHDIIQKINKLKVFNRSCCRNNIDET